MGLTVIIVLGAISLLAPAIGVGLGCLGLLSLGSGLLMALGLRDRHEALAEVACDTSPIPLFSNAFWATSVVVGFCPPMVLVVISASALIWIGKQLL